MGRPCTPWGRATADTYGFRCSTSSPIKARIENANSVSGVTMVTQINANTALPFLMTPSIVKLVETSAHRSQRRQNNVNWLRQWPGTSCIGHGRLTPRATHGEKQACVGASGKLARGNTRNNYACLHGVWHSQARMNSVIGSHAPSHVAGASPVLKKQLRPSSWCWAKLEGVVAPKP